jgi:hypothetical protein
MDISKSIILEFCGTYFGSQKGGLDVLFTTPSMEDLILAFDDDGDDDDDDKDGEVQLHVDVGCTIKKFGFCNCRLQLKFNCMRHMQL